MTVPPDALELPGFGFHAWCEIALLTGFAAVALPVVCLSASARNTTARVYANDGLASLEPPFSSE